MAENGRSNQPSTRGRPAPLLRRMDQAAVATLVLFALVGMGVYWFVHGGHRGELIEIDRAEPLTAQYVLDINSAPCDDAPRMKLLADLVFKATDLRESPFDSRATPSIGAAERLRTDWLAASPRHYRKILADGRRGGLSPSTFYKSKRRMGIVHEDGNWTLA